MANVANQNQLSRSRLNEKTAIQKMTISIGVAILVVGVGGVLMPNLFGMHLSLMHNLIHLLTGFFAIWFGASRPSRAYNFTLLMGTVYAIAGILGFIFGSPGYPTTGSLDADQNLVRLIPDFLEIGTIDHIAHILIGAFMLFTCYTFREDKNIRTQKS
jgi:hypothetical protein